MKIIHFIGIGGIGMSALARYFKAQNWAVSGSDLVSSRLTSQLIKEGIKVKIGHKKGHISSKIGLVVYSRAVGPDNPELAAARHRNIPTLSYPEAVGHLTKKYKTIAIAGAHGKSTTTALVGLILNNAGLDPTIIIGTELKELNSRNFRLGRGKWLVLEADEFGRSFLNYLPAVAVVTNVDLEHLDTYKNLADIKNTFLKFISNTKEGGVLVLNHDSRNLLSLKNRIQKIAEKKNYRVLWYSVNGNTAKKIKKIIKIPGAHNISNAVAAYKAGRALGIPHGKILSAIGSYRGAWRRMEYKGKFSILNSQFSIFDDYAHHPTEIKATLKAFKEKYPRSPIVCVYQPHQAKRLRALFKDFENSFDDTDILVLIPVYQVTGRDRINPRFTSKTLAAAIQKKYHQKQVYYLSNPKNVKSFLSKIFSYQSSLHHSRAVIIMMGAGDVVNYTNLLLK